MKKIVIVSMLVLACTVSELFGAELKDRSASLIDKNGTVMKVMGVFIHSEPEGFYESRFCLTVLNGFIKVAIPSENLISVEVEGENCQALYQWMGKRQVISGKVASDTIGGRSDGVGYVSLGFHNLKKVIFHEEPAVMKAEELPPYETTLVLTDGTKIPAAKLLRISSQPYPAAPLSGVGEGTIFEVHNDVGFLRGEAGPAIRFEDIKSMEFPTENTMTLTLKQDMKDTPERPKKDKALKGDKEEAFLLKALDELIEQESDTGKSPPKNWAYGFTGICSKGYFFVSGRRVKAIEFNVE